MPTFLTSFGIVRLLAPVLLLSAAVAVSAQPAAEAPPLFSAERFRSHVSFLASDLLEGRESGSRGHAIAAAYVASQFEGLGLEPGGKDGSWFQSVPLRTATLGTSAPSLTITTRAGSRTWKNGTEVLVVPSVMEREQNISAPVVFVGYGLDAPDQGLDDYRGLDVRGKIVAVLSGMPPDLPSEIAAHLSNEKLAMAARHGAVGMVTVDTDLSEKASSWDLRVRRSGGPSMGWVGPDGRVRDESPGVRFTARLSSKAAAALFQGAPRDYAAVRAEAADPKARPRGFPLESRLQLRRSSVWTETISQNVIGLLPGSDPVLRDEYIVILGHLDHIGMRDAGPGEDRIMNGALDNAAGIATLIEAARAFSISGERPRRSILFLAVTAEEKGLLGSDYFAHNPTVPIGSIAAAVNLDMPILLYDFTDVVAFGAEHSSLASAVEEAARSMGLGVGPDPMPEESIFVRSDHYSFVRRGVPAIMLETGFGNGGGDKWREFLTGNYHGPGDEIDQPIHWEAAARFARLNFLIARTLANADQRPLWYRDDYFGNLFAPDAPKVAWPAESGGLSRAAE